MEKRFISLRTEALKQKEFNPGKERDQRAIIRKEGLLKVVWRHDIRGKGLSHGFSIDKKKVEGAVQLPVDTLGRNIFSSEERIPHRRNLDRTKASDAEGQERLKQVSRGDGWRSKGPTQNRVAKRKKKH